MKLSLASLAAYCAAVALLLSSAGPVAAQSGACPDTDCFYDRQVRDFRVVDSDTVIIYVGRRRCPFLVNVTGFYCDLKLLPDIDFFHERNRRMDVVTGIQGRRPRGFVDAGRDGFTQNDRICTNNAPQYALETFGFGPYHPDDIPNDRAECPVTSVTRLVDDDLVELYTLQGMPPPPPIGNGTISRGGAAEQAD